jgi:hypothetical protein
MGDARGRSPMPIKEGAQDGTSVEGNHRVP